jgi:hypothetical protein
MTLLMAELLTMLKELPEAHQDDIASQLIGDVIEIKFRLEGQPYGGAPVVPPQSCI